MRSFAAFVLTVALAGAAAAQTREQVDPALRARFGFSGPLNHKVGDGLSLLRVADVDGRPGDEAVVYHGNRGRIAILRCEDGTVAETHVDTGGVIHGLAIADVDGEPGSEWLLYDRRGRIEIREAGGESVRGTVEVGPAANGDAVRAADVDRDGRADAVVWTRDGIRVVTGLGGNPRVGPVSPVGLDRNDGFHLCDADGDGALDLVLGGAAESVPLWVRRGRGDGTFAAWLNFELPRMTTAFPGTGAGGAPTLTVVQDQRNRVVDYRLRRGEGGAAPAQVTLPPLKRGAFPFARGDVDGDGDDDLVLAHPDRAELYYLLENGGRFEVRSVPSLAGISSVALGDVDGDGALDLLVASPGEETIAWKAGALPLDRFPARLPSIDGPVTVAVGPAGEVLVLGKDKKRDGTLWRLRWADGAFGEPESVAALGRLSGEPQRLLLGEFDAHPGPDVAFVVPGVGLRVLRSADGGGFRGGEDELAEVGFADKAPDGSVGVVRVDGEDALLVARPGFARTFRIDANGEPAVLDQVNGPPGSKELAFGTVGAGGARMLYDRETNALWRLAPDSPPVAVPLPVVGATHLLDHGGVAVVIGTTGVLRVAFDGGWQLDRVREHEPPREETNYWRGLTADLDGDGAAELVLLDEDNNGVVVLVAGEALRLALTFPVLEIPNKNGRVYEPHEMAGGDWNGDGRDDLVLLANDRVLIYPQEH